jgi:hypothetical protein
MNYTYEVHGLQEGFTKTDVVIQLIEAGIIARPMEVLYRGTGSDEVWKVGCESILTVENRSFKIDNGPFVVLHETRDTKNKIAKLAEQRKAGLVDGIWTPQKPYEVPDENEVPWYKLVGIDWTCEHCGITNSDTKKKEAAKPKTVQQNS